MFDSILFTLSDVVVVVVHAVFLIVVDSVTVCGRLNRFSLEVVAALNVVVVVGLVVETASNDTSLGVVVDKAMFLGLDVVDGEKIG